MSDSDRSPSPLIRTPAETGKTEPAVSLLAWIIVAVTAITMTIASGARFLFGVVLKPVSEEYGWDRAELTGAVLLGMVVLSICQPIVGMVVEGEKVIGQTETGTTSCTCTSAASTSRGSTSTGRAKNCWYHN